MPRLSKSTNWLWSAVSALLLFVVAAHAMEPMRGDHQRVRGSAFSASTEEVSLKAAAPTSIAKEVVRLEPVLPPQLVAAPAADRSEALGPTAFAAGDASVVAADTALHPISPRAPPLA